MNPESIKYIDVHTHLNFASFDKDREEVVKRAKEAGVAMINVGTDKETSVEVVRLAHKYENMWAIVGEHPVENGSDGSQNFDYDFYKKLATDPKVVAIGECGLEYFRIEDEEIIKKQKEIFIQHIKLANEVNKPLMLHVRSGVNKSAYKDAVEILKREAKVKGDFHFFAGNWEEAKEILDLGFYLSFDGPITFARNYDEVIKNAPLDKIMSETDAPFAAPLPYRGKRNEPAYVVEIVKKIAEIRGEDLEKVRVQLLENARNLFGLTF